jgi:phage tail sheath protein FI
LWAQRYLIDRLLRTRWRWIAILTPPPGRDAQGAVDWRQLLLKGTEGADVAALYWPWLLAQDSPGAPVEERTPVGAVAGIYAQVDIAIGPHAAPANRTVEGAVGLAAPIGDEENALAYDSGVNVLRDFPGIGIQLWGARTLLWQDRSSRGEPLAFVNARRCLSAICRSAEVIGQPMVFQPNTAIMRIKLHQLMTDYLLRVFAGGALKGATPEEAFFVEVPPVADTPEGQLVCNIGVALAAPAEFIVFRIGRESGVIERAEAA